MVSSFHQSREFLYGRAGEEQIKAWLQSRHWYIIPAADYTGPEGDQAPTLQGAADRIVLPDLGLARAGELKWAEVKAKWQPTYSRCTGTLDHGIGRRLWRHYYHFQQATGAAVWLFILEGCTQTLLAQRVTELSRGADHIYEDDGMDPGGMIYWRRERFFRIVLDEIPGLFDVKIPLPFESDPR